MSSATKRTEHVIVFKARAWPDASRIEHRLTCDHEQTVAFLKGAIRQAGGTVTSVIQIETTERVKERSVEPTKLPGLNRCAWTLSLRHGHARCELGVGHEGPHIAWRNQRHPGGHREIRFTSKEATASAKDEGLY